MLVIPSLFLKDGKAVSSANPVDGEGGFTLVSDDPVDLAGRWMDQGAKRLHVVDIDGKQAGKPVHKDLIAQIAMRFPNFELQVSGGIRELATMADYARVGVNYLVLNSLAVENPDLVEDACLAFPEKIVVGLVDGNDVDLNELISRYNSYGIASFLYSDAASEQKNQGINLRAMVDVVSQATVPVMLSGGISEMVDVEAIAAHAFKGVEGVVIGKPFYKASHEDRASLDLLEAQHYCDNAHRFAM